MIELNNIWNKHRRLIIIGYSFLGIGWLMLIWAFVITVESALTAFIIGFFSALMMLLPASIFFIPKLRQYLDQKIREFSDLLNAAAGLVKNYLEGGSKGLERDSLEFLSSWVLFVGNRWMLSWAMWASATIFIILSSVLGTILFLEQNKKLGIQNELLTSQNSLAYVQTFAEFGKPFRVEKQSINYPTESSVGSSACGVELTLDKLLELYPIPNKSDLEQLKAFAKSDVIGRDVVKSLRLLTKDDHPTVKLAALMVLDDIEGGLEGLNGVVLEDMYIHDVTLNSDIDIFLRNSFSHGFACDRCRVYLNGTYFLGSYFEKLKVVNNSVLDTDAEVWPSRIHNSLLKMKTQIGDEKFLELFTRLGDENFYIKDNKIYNEDVSNLANPKSCDVLRGFCKSNNLLACE